MTADDILPLIANLPPRERARLMRLITQSSGADEAAIYAAVPPRRDEFTSDEEPLGWDANGWGDGD